MIDHLHEGVALRTILFQYNATPPGGKKAGHKEHIPCAFGHGVKHWKGYGIELEDGRRALIGKDCGKKHFGLDFQSFENSFRAEATRQYELNRLIALREAMPAALAELAALASKPAVIAYDAYWNAMRRHFGNMSQALAKSVRSYQGRLMTIERMLSCTPSLSSHEVIAVLHHSPKDVASIHYRRSKARLRGLATLGGSHRRHFIGTEHQ